MFLTYQAPEVEKFYREHLEKFSEGAPLKVLRACKLEFIYEDYYANAEAYVIEKNGRKFIYVPYSHPDYDIDRIPAVIGEKDLPVYDDAWDLWEEGVLTEEEVRWLDTNLPLIDAYELFREYK